jgi:hypothetical protein
MLWIPTARTTAATGLELHLKVNPVVEDVTNVTGGGLCCRLLALVERRCGLRLNPKMAVMQLANANSDLAVEPNRDVSNLYVSRRNRDNETVIELCAKPVAWHKTLKFGQKSLGEAVELWCW